METLFRITGHLCGNSPVTGDFPAQRPVTQSFDVFFDLRLNKRLSKLPWGWWFETPSRPLLRHCNAFFSIVHQWHIKGKPRFQPPMAYNRKASSGKSRHNETICHCLGLCHETIVCLFIFFWICDMVILLHGISVSWCLLPRTWSPVTDMQHYRDCKCGWPFHKASEVGFHPIWWRWHGNTKSLSKVQSSDV